MVLILILLVDSFKITVKKHWKNNKAYFCAHVFIKIDFDLTIKSLL